MQSFLKGVLAGSVGVMCSVSVLGQQGGRTLPPAASAPLDSLRAALHRPGLPDTARVLQLVAISKRYMATDLDSARWYSEQGLALARRCGFGRGEVKALNNLAAAAFYSSDYPTAQHTFEAELRAAQRAHDQENIGHAYLGLGNVASVLKNEAQARAYFMQAREAYAACRPRNIRGELLVLHNLANGYLSATATPRQLARVRMFVNQGLRLSNQANSPQTTKLKLVLGTVQALSHQPDSATATWQNVLRVCHAHADFSTEGEAWLHLADLAQSQNQPELALLRAQQAAKLFRQLKDDNLLAQILDMKASLLAALHRPEAYDTLRRYTELRDTLLSRERLEAVATAQAQFKQTEQQARIRALEQERRIAELEAGQRTVRTRLLLGGLALGGLLLAGAGMGTYRRRQQRREAALRNQLAADLHDDVGSLLTQISMQTDLLQEGLVPLGAQPALWAGLAENSRAALRQLNDVVWNLDAQNDSVPDLLNRLRDYAHEVLVPTGRDVRFVTDKVWESPALSATVRRHLYFIYKEVMHNILKYAPATATVTVALHCQMPLLVLEVVNDGPVLSAPAESGRSSGHGLRNIRARAQAMGGSATAGAQATGGFAVRVQVPVS
ncbi:tetratricopeptide repeat-containing sensor histidine kinase [Hymenobacter rubidus]|uniref:tetratricopeptide repeat-containing sensor histidine kinase n=1 Tax=Hymenobacter rubidus TaxID=1441626 RepID=UPI00191EA290|nr:ATP-binding protein [Hymenobacter rubidus]